MYIIICEIDCQSRFDAWDRVLRAGALGWPRGMGWGGRWEGGLGWGTHVNPWLIHVTEWQKPLQYFKVINFQLIKINEKKKKKHFPLWWLSTTKDPCIGFGCGRTQGRGGGNIIDCGVRGLGSNSALQVWPRASQSGLWHLSDPRYETGQRIQALTELLCSSNQVMNTEQLRKLKTPYKYLPRNILHCIHT